MKNPDSATATLCGPASGAGLARSPGRHSELASRKSIVLGSFVGFFVTSVALMTYSMGLFSSEFTRLYGWSHADVAFSYSIYSIVMFLGSVPSGWAADRFGPGRVAVVGMFGFATALFLVPYIVYDVRTLWLAYALIGFLSLGATYTVLVKPLIVNFSASRGLATGIALCGSGIAGMVVPGLIHVLISSGDWRTGYTGLGCLVLAAIPIVWFTLARGKATQAPESGLQHAPAPVELEGMTFREAVRKPVFWTLTVLALLMSLAITGLVPHLVPMLREEGLSVKTAASYASLLGGSSMMGRIGCGMVLDRMHGRTAGFFIFLAGAVGALMLALGGPSLAALAVVLIGLALGSEVDLIVYLISRYFGRAHHGVLFGWTYAAISLGAIVGPVLIGALRDHSGEFTLSLIVSTGILGLCSLTFLTLGRYRYAVQGH